MTASNEPSGVVLLTVPEACARLRVSRWMFYRLLQRRELQTITIGTRRLVASSAIDAYVARRSEEASR